MIWTVSISLPPILCHIPFSEAHVPTVTVKPHFSRSPGTSGIQWSNSLFSFDSSATIHLIIHFMKEFLSSFQTPEFSNLPPTSPAVPFPFSFLDSLSPFSQALRLECPKAQFSSVLSPPLLNALPFSSLLSPSSWVLI